MARKIFGKGKGETKTPAPPVADEQASQPYGSTLGIIDPDPHLKKLPVKPGGGHPRGIDVRTPATGIGDLRQSTGFAGPDMGGGGEGDEINFDTSIDREPTE